MARRRGQVMILFVAMLPVLLGFLGLALDGGQYFALRRAAQIAASAAARAAAVEVRDARASGATARGQAVGLYNLSGYRLSGPAIALAYNDALDATPTSPGWGPTPSASTGSVLATASGGYTTLLMHFVGLPSLTLQRQAVASLQGGGAPPSEIVPLAICQQTSAAMDANPTTLQPIWVRHGNNCGVTHWSGLIPIGLKDDCGSCQAEILPAPNGTPPTIGTKLPLTDRDCDKIETWMGTLTNKNVWIAVVVPDSTASKTPGTIVCYRQVSITISKERVDGTPTDLSTCGGIRETY